MKSKYSQGIISSLQHNYYVINRDYEIIESNDQQCQTNAKCYDYLFGVDKPCQNEIHTCPFQLDGSHSQTCTITIGETPATFQLQSTPLVDDDGTKTHIISHFISRQNIYKDGNPGSHENNLKTNSVFNSAFQSLIQGRSESIWSIDRNYRILEFNSFFEHEFFAAFNKVLCQGINALDVLTDELKKIWKPEYDAALAGEATRFEFSYEIKGGIHHYLVALNPIIDDDKIVGASIISADITERKQAEKKLAQNEQMLSAVTSASGDYILMLDNELRIQYANRTEPGVEKESILGIPLYKLVEMQDQARVRRHLAEVLDKAKRQVYETVFHRPDGDKVYFKSVAVPLFSDGNVNGIIVNSRDITTDKQAKAAMEKNEQQLSTLMGNLPGMAYQCKNDRHWTMLFVNEACEPLTGYRPDQLLHNTKISFNEIIHPDDRVAVRRDVINSIENGRRFELEYRIVTKSGAVKWVWERGIQGDLNSDKGAKLEGVIHDISERKQTEVALRNSEQRFWTLVESAPMALYETDSQGSCVYVNKMWRQLAGISLKDALGDGWQNGLYKDDRSRIFELWNKYAKQQKPWSMEYRFCTPDGKISWVIGHATALRDADGLVTGYLGANVDVTEHKMAEHKLQQSEEYFRTLIENSSDVIAILNKEGIIIFESPSHKRVLGYNQDELVGENAFDLVHPDDKESLAIQFSNLLKMHDAIEYVDFRFLHKDGAWRYLGGTAANMLKSPSINGLVINYRDITQHKMAQIALVESEEQFRFLSEQSLMSIMILQEDTYKYLNQAFSNITGYSVDEALKWGPSEWTKLIYPDDLAFVLQQRQKKVDGVADAISQYSYRIVSKNGDMKWVDQFSKPIIYGGKVAILVTGIEITDRIKAEKELDDHRKNLEDIVKERTAELEELNNDLESFVYSISHDLRAPLRHIDGFAGLLRKTFANENKTSERYFKKINESSRKMSTMIDDLLSFSRLGRKPIQKTKVDLNMLANKTIEHFKSETATRHIEWRVGELESVDGDENLLLMVFENLISNAVKFTAKKEFALIEIDSFKSDNAKCGFYVKDNGSGFDMAHTNNLFGVFQRLHSVEEFEGTGIGLANVKKIIQKHGGAIKAKAELDKGAMFYVTL
jgi:PAS domain S-box-containing protein